MSKRQIGNNTILPMHLEDVQSFAVEERVVNLTHEERENQQNEGVPATQEPESWAAFLDYTTFHGIRFFAEGNWLRRIVWVAAVSLAFGYCWYMLVLSVKQYRDHPFVTQITRHDVSKIPFPAVTLCNFNRVNKDRTGATDHPEGPPPAPNSSPGEKNPEHKNLLDEISSRTFEEVYTEASHRLEDMLLPRELKPCRLGAVRCDASNFTGFPSVHFGQCYTINSRDHRIMDTERAGASGGLHLRLNVERDSYMYEPVNPLVGFKVLVHPQNVNPGLIDDVGFAVEPGKHTFCSIRKKWVSSQGPGFWAPYP